MERPLRDISDRIISMLEPEHGRLAAHALLDDSRIPESVRGFLLMEIEFAVEADLATLKSHFQLESEFESSLYHTFFLGLAAHSTLSLGDAARLVERSVEDAVAYLTKPQETLVALLLQNAGRDSVIVLDDRFFHTLEYVRCYPHLRDVLYAWAARQNADGVQSVAPADLRALLRKIDQSVTGIYGIEQLRELLDPLYDLFGGRSIPCGMLEAFFRDKGASAAVKELQRDERPELSQTELLGILARLLRNGGQASSPREKRDREPETTAYSNFLEELRQAGVVLGAPRDTDLLRQIAAKNGSVETSQTEASLKTSGSERGSATRPSPHDN